MSIEERKQQLHLYIDSINDEEELEVISDTLEIYAPHQKNGNDYLTPEQRQRLEESIQQAKMGMVIPHEEVMKMARQWITK